MSWTWPFERKKPHEPLWSNKKKLWKNRCINCVTGFLPLFCSAYSVDSKDTLLRLSTPSWGKSWGQCTSLKPLEQPQLITKSYRKTAAWLNNEEFRIDFSPEGRVSGLKTKMSELHERLQNPSDTEGLSLKHRQKMQSDSTWELYPIKNVKRLSVRNRKHTLLQRWYH